MDHFPLTPWGKVQKFPLRDGFVARAPAAGGGGVAGLIRLEWPNGGPPPSCHPRARLQRDPEPQSEDLVGPVEAGVQPAREE